MADRDTYFIANNLTYDLIAQLTDLNLSPVDQLTVMALVMEGLQPHLNTARESAAAQRVVDRDLSKGDRA